MSIMDEKLSSNQLYFSDAMAICNDANKYINKFSYKRLREIYLLSLQKSLDFIPQSQQSNQHIDWLNVHKNNINKDASGKYVIKSSFEKMFLKRKYLYGTLMIESPNVTLDVEVLGDNSICTQDKICKTPLNVNKIRSGEKIILLRNKDKKINNKIKINLHPHQEYVLYIE